LTANGKSDSTTKRATQRKVAAVLAGGLVLGVGTMATLASWNDSEFASATFTAGQFNLEGAVDASQAVFGEHASSAGAGGLTFTAPFNNLTPTDVVAAPFAVRLAAGTTNNATLKLAAATSTGTVANLTYTVVQTATAGCTTASTGTVIVPAGTPVTSEYTLYLPALGNVARPGSGLDEVDPQVQVAPEHTLYLPALGNHD
jgi:predicted ribosomally synthesized peptide with SipW-like signal peptide